jgi:hypothetical protein
MAAAADGSVDLSWRAVSRAEPEKKTGYLVYFGETSGVYRGTHAIIDGKQVVSPVDAGTGTSLRLEGLKNGALYYFAVASYDAEARDGVPYNDGALAAGEFSREVAARPRR